LESDTGVIAVEVAVLDQILDGIDDLNESAQLPRHLFVGYRPSLIGLLVRDVLPTLHPSSVFLLVRSVAEFGPMVSYSWIREGIEFWGSGLEKFVGR